MGRPLALVERVAGPVRSVGQGPPRPRPGAAGAPGRRHAGWRWPRLPGAGRGARYPLQGRHVRRHRLVRVGGALAAPDVALADDLLVLQVLRLRPATDLDPAEVAALSALPPSIVAPALDRLARSGLARDALVGGRVRFGLS
jgi:hypothetical protein